jgi:hypothetical protein
MITTIKYRSKDEQTGMNNNRHAPPVGVVVKASTRNISARKNF